MALPATAQGHLLTWLTSEHQSTDFPRTMSLTTPYENHLIASGSDIV